ncbi:hypothetical protein [Synechococcus sp. PCC 7335]|uniref:hypothetical protein n=1 Tax=Synechococcus sp. (strain ATCC 29403 / PCC 7335) TaxID=91464 RepID=UPI0012F851A5|nr:hypothetical protein [Synechococcus sp. PCC 7335]
MYVAQVFEWPHPQIDQDWAVSKWCWREITPLAYRELKASGPLLYEARDAFMQAEPADDYPTPSASAKDAGRHCGSQCFSRRCSTLDQ